MTKTNFRRFSKRAVSIVLSLMMIASLFAFGTISSSAATAYTYDGTTYLYVDTSACSWYTDSGAVPAVKFYSGTSGLADYRNMTPVSGKTTVFKTLIPAGNYAEFSIKRVYSSASGNEWHNVQLPSATNLSNKTNNCYKLNSTPNGGSWTSYKDSSTPQPTGGYEYVKTELFNYLYDSQLNNSADNNTGNMSGVSDSGNSENGAVNSKLNKAISDYFSKNNSNKTTKKVYGYNPTTGTTGSFDSSSLTPLYFGTFWPAKAGEGSSLIDSSFFHRSMPANTANRKDGDSSINASMHAVAKGLVDNELNEDGELTQLGIVMPYFSKDWFKNNTYKESSSSLTITFANNGVANLATVTLNISAGKAYYLDFYGNNNVKTGEDSAHTSSAPPNGVYLTFTHKASGWSDKVNKATIKDSSGSVLKTFSFTDTGGTEVTLPSSGNGKPYAHIYDTTFPMTISESNGIVTYQYDSLTEANRYLDTSDTSQMKLASSSIKNSDGKSGYYAFSNSQSNRKFAFGTKFEIPFYMTENGKIKGTDGTEKDIKFEFSGDDDVWVFIDGKLALDMGGAHCAAKGWIDFAQMKSYVKTQNGEMGITDGNNASNYLGAYSFTTDAATNTTSYRKDDSGYDISNILDRSDTTKQHTLTFFYMERGFRDSNMKITYNLPKTPQITTLAVNNVINTDNVNDVLLNDTLITADNDGFNYEVAGNRANADANTISWTNEAAFTRPSPDGTTTTLADAGTYDGYFASAGTALTPLNKVAIRWYDFCNGGDYQIGAGTTAANSVTPLTLLYNQSAGFNTQLAIHTDDIDSKVQVGQTNNLSKANKTGTLTFGSSDRTVAEYYNTNWLLYTNNDKTAIVGEGTGNGATNYVKRNGGTTDTFDYSATTSSGNDAYYSAEFVNTVKTQNISFKKTFAAGETNTSALFDFEIKFTGVFGGEKGEYKAYDNLECEVTGNDGATTTVHTDADGKIYGIKGGDTVTVKGVPVGTWVSIKELDNATIPFGVSSLKQTGLSGASTDAANKTVTGQVSTTDSADVEITFENSSTTHTVTYKYHPRITENGQPTVMDNVNYVEFVKEVPGALTKENIIAYAPYIDNILDDYSLTEDDIVINGDTATATFTNKPATYSVNWSVGDQSGVVKKEFNELVLKDEISAPLKNSADKDFLYWAVLKYTDPVAGTQVWTPISTQNNYRYRITNDITIKAVYDGDQADIYTGLKFVNENETAYGAYASQSVYDTYTTDQGVDRVRANVIFGAVGSPDVDNEITQIGYLRLTAYNGYCTDLTREEVQNAVEGTGTINKTVNGKNVLVTKKTYNVGNVLEPDTTNYPYQAQGNVNLTNKNRANFVFDMERKDANMSKYYTVYTYMVRGGVTYVSPTPAFVALADAPSKDNPTPIIPTVVTINTSVNNSDLGMLTASAAAVEAGKSVTFTATPKAAAVIEGQNVVPQFDKLTINGTEVTPTLTDGKYVYTYTTSKDDTVLNAVAEFSYKVVKPYSVTVTADTGISYVGLSTGGTSYESDELDTIGVSAIPEDGYTFDGWYRAGEKVSSDYYYEFTFTADDANHPVTLTAKATKNPENVIVTAAVNNTSYGSVTPNSWTTQAGTGTQMFTATAKSGYEFDSWSYDQTKAVVTKNGNTLTVSNPTANFTVTANFKVKSGTTIRLNISSYTGWANASAKFTVAYRNTSGGDSKVSLTKVSDNVYEATVTDANFSGTWNDGGNIAFFRQGPSQSTSDCWNSNWNSVRTTYQSGKTFYITGWDNGEWR